MFSRLFSKSSPNLIIPTPITATFLLIMLRLHQLELVTVDIQPSISREFSEDHLYLSAYLHILGGAEFRHQPLIPAATFQIYDNRHNRRLEIGRWSPIYAERVYCSSLGKLVLFHILAAAFMADFGDRKSTRLNSSHGYISYA